MMRVLKTGMILLILVHFCACSFWLVKTLSNSHEDFIGFLEHHELDERLVYDLWGKYMVCLLYRSTWTLL